MWGDDLIGQVVRWGRVSSMMAEYDWSPGVSVKQGQVVGFASTPSLCLLNSCCGKHVCCLAATCSTPLSPYFICSVSLSRIPSFLKPNPFSSLSLCHFSFSLHLPLSFLPLSLSPMLLSIWWDWSPMRYRSRVSQGKVPNSSCAITPSTTITILTYPCKLPTHHLPPPCNAIVGLHSIPSRP